MSDTVSRKGVLHNSRKQADFLSRLGSPSGDKHVKQFIASCNADMLVPFITITKWGKRREVEYEITLPESEGEADKAYWAREGLIARLKFEIIEADAWREHWRREYVDERAAHNAHVAELCAAEQEIKRLRTERDCWKKGLQWYADLPHGTRSDGHFARVWIDQATLSSTSETAVQPLDWIPVIINPSTDLEHIRCLVTDGKNYGSGGWYKWPPEMDRTGFYADDFAPVISDEITHYMIVKPPGIKDGRDTDA